MATSLGLEEEENEEEEEEDCFLEGILLCGGRYFFDEKINRTLTFPPYFHLNDNYSFLLSMYK